ncbi:Oligopeptide transport ATP-binding protein OppD [Achromobacter aegrifaciens]|uniref:ATP-binding cassette domain-containing protein n=1 Tax=Achromobacter aegrifaciens TaxID=1287736 RepID=UPI001465B174|nr:ABC transporter ATP-binding protein [Achromobacter aegrifaciens]CAB3871287.1 Oligopeptide transport ATP-binding protein OppD [Achromobacter aegrifaciens]
MSNTPSVAVTVNHLEISLSQRGTNNVLVDDISFTLARGETLGIVGESGSGKTLTSLALMGLLHPPLSVTKGEILLDGVNLAGLPEARLRTLRGNRIAMVFQEPMTSLNPVLTIGRQLVETLRAHKPVSQAQARDKAVALLERVRIPDAANKLASYPHEFSGGMRQRVMIAMAMMCDPHVLIADEPTTALDVTIQAEVLSLLRDIQQEFGTAIVFISHDLGVIGDVADRVMVMYRGRAVEAGSAADVLLKPQHDYTRALIGARPKLVRGEQALALEERGPLIEVSSNAA